MVIGISDGGKRVAYSVKRLQNDPWSEAIAQFISFGVIIKRLLKIVLFFVLKYGHSIVCNVSK